MLVTLGRINTQICDLISQAPPNGCSLRLFKLLRCKTIYPPINSTSTTMAPIIHKIDPNGDTLLIFRNPGAPFAVGDASSCWPDALPDYRTKEMIENEQDITNPVRAKRTTKYSIKEVHFQLSSKHLTLASEYFQRLTANNWREVNSEGSFAYSITVEDWDESALLVVMKILHGQSKNVPRGIELEMFAKIAVLADYYQCHEAFDFYAQAWSLDLRNNRLDPHILWKKTLAWAFCILYIFSFRRFSKLDRDCHSRE